MTKESRNLNVYSLLFSGQQGSSVPDESVYLLCFFLDLYCTLEVDSYGYFVSKAKTRVFRDTTEPQWNEVSHQDISFYCTLLHSCLYAKANILFSFSASVVEKEFEIELEGSQYLRILCYETCYDKSMLNKDDNEIVDKIMGKGQVQVRRRLLTGHHRNKPYTKRDICLHLGTFPSM